MDLAVELEKDLKWREAELAAFKRALSAATPGAVRHDALLRAMLLLVYAHFEGFCKFAWDLYLQIIEDTKPRRSDLVDALACFSMERDFRQLRGNTSPESLWNFCTNLYPSLLNDEAQFSIRLETQSNLWPSLYSQNMLKAGLPDSAMSEHAARIKSLVNRRNDIAHGQKVAISDISEYQSYEDAALEVMHDLAVAILETVEGKTFLK